jgi:hypothetical protein
MDRVSILEQPGHCIRSEHDVRVNCTEPFKVVGEKLLHEKISPERQERSSGGRNDSTDRRIALRARHGVEH